MSFTLTPSQDGKYITAKVTVDMTRELALEIVIQGFALGRELGINRYLLDLTESRNRESAFGSYESAYDDLAPLSRQSSLLRAAVLVAPQDHSHDFNETVLRNASLDVKLFRDRELAVQYLLRD